METHESLIYREWMIPTNAESLILGLHLFNEISQGFLSHCFSFRVNLSHCGNIFLRSFPFSVILYSPTTINMRSIDNLCHYMIFGGDLWGSSRPYLGHWGFFLHFLWGSMVYCYNWWLNIDHCGDLFDGIPLKLYGIPPNTNLIDNFNLGY